MFNQERMQIHDPVYGDFTITEPVLVELINSKPVQRLKKIKQFGLPQELVNILHFSRYDHCLGVMLLLRKLGASIEEQAAGLLHDVSHLAFSHVVDWVFGDPSKEDYQDSIHKTFIINTEIPTILKKHNLDVERIMHLDHFSLLENHAPDLCADRVDYSLRELQGWDEKELVAEVVQNLISHKGEIILKNKITAERFARAYSRLQRERWAEVKQNIQYHLFAKMLKDALENKIITEKDFYEHDEYVMNKLKNAKGEKLATELEKMKNVKYRPGTELQSKPKMRYIDPKYREGKVYRLSETNKAFKEFLAEQKRINDLGINVDIL